MRVSSKTVQVTKMRPAVDVPPKLLTAIHGLSRKSLLLSGLKTIEGESKVAPPSIDRLTRITFTPVSKSEPVAAKVLRKILPSKSIPATGSVARGCRATGQGGEIRNQRPRPGEATVVGYPSSRSRPHRHLRRSGPPERPRSAIRIDRRARDMGFDLPLKPQGQWCRIVTETKIWRDAQIENDCGSRLGPNGRGGGWPDEIAPAIERREGAGREAVERDVLQCCGPTAPIGGGERDSGRRRCVGR